MDDALAGRGGGGDDYYHASNQPPGSGRARIATALVVVGDRASMLMIRHRRRALPVVDSRYATRRCRFVVDIFLTAAFAVLRATGREQRRRRTTRFLYEFRARNRQPILFVSAVKNISYRPPFRKRKPYIFQKTFFCRLSVSDTQFYYYISNTS